MPLALAYFFSIHNPTAPKLAYVGLCALNALLMLTLAWRARLPFFRLYLYAMAAATLLQNSPLWNLAGEVILAAFTALWVAEMLPEDRRGRVEALAMGLLLGAALMFAVPDAWPGFPPSMYFVRLYSTAAALGVALPCAILARRNAIAIPWFAAVLFAGSQRGLDKWAIGISANLIWTACLLAWITMEVGGKARLRHAPSGPPSS